MPKSKHLLYLTSESWPTFRVDVATLFGNHLPKHGVRSDLVTDLEFDTKEPPPWPPGRSYLSPAHRNKGKKYLYKFLHLTRTLLTKARVQTYSAIQVRDMAVMGALAVLVGWMRGIPVLYWMSYPHPEGQLERARSIGLSAGARYWFLLAQGTLGKFLLYRFVLPNVSHIFVQSEQMKRDVATHGIPPKKMTPVPMAVDIDYIKSLDIQPIQDSRLNGKRVVIYLGTLDRAREIEKLFEMVRIAKRHIPNLLLILAGDIDEHSHKQWLRDQAQAMNIENELLWTGWLPMETAWRYVKAAEVGVSPIPRGILLDCGSPTKTVEYMALGVPVLGNDNPDQEMLITESGAGICTPYTPESFSNGLIKLLNLTTQERDSIVKSGLMYVSSRRDYAQLARHLAEVYHTVLA